MKITVGVGDGIPKNEVRITYMSVDLIYDSMVSLTYEIGTSVKNIKISVFEATEIGLLNFDKLQNVLK